MEFVKMHGLGNDFILIQGEKEHSHYEKKAIEWCDRHTGIGGDGLVIYGVDKEADLFMRIYNCDGSQAMMCGNAIRCLGKHAYESGLMQQERMTVVTPGGCKTLELTVVEDRVSGIRVDMGVPELRPAYLPSVAEGETFIDRPLKVEGETVVATMVNMGNPHLVIFCENVLDLDLGAMGPLYEHHPLFPDRVNAEWAELLPDGSIRMRVYERGAGETQACGTGACAVMVAARLTGRTGKETLIHLPGGELKLFWENREDPVYMEGPAAYVYYGRTPE